MKAGLSLAMLLLCTVVSAVSQDSQRPSVTRKAVLMEGLGTHHHPIATKNAEAQKFFDQGMILNFGFNHDEAVRSFQRATELDPDAAMPYWGVAWALGPRYAWTAVTPGYDILVD